jgi:signal transduction histidine kinase
MTLLIVDDSPMNLSVLSDALTRAGLQFRVAKNGEHAIAEAESNPPDLILLDVQMPGIDGFETCRRLKANPNTQTIPVIFTTALTDAASKVKGFAVGAVDYIPKPFTQEEVIARVQVHLRLKHLTETLEQQVQERSMALQQAQMHLVQQEKLAMLGELIAGIGHEINNPINFIASNLKPLKEHTTGIAEILQLYQSEYPYPPAQITEAIESLDLAFALEDTAKILNSLKIGTDRIKQISVSLRTFARADSETMMAMDLHQGLESTLMILQHRLKAKENQPSIQVLKSYGILPNVTCYPGQLNQVFMNILANAIDALEEAIEQGNVTHPQIKITTDMEDGTDKILVRIADNGIGIPEAIQPRLFEPLFTTKSVGKGTGLGLSIAHQIVVEKHHGRLEMQSQAGQGSEFVIKIPIIANVSRVAESLSGVG